MRLLLPTTLLLAVVTGAQPTAIDAPSPADLDVDFRGGRFRQSVLIYTPKAKDYVTLEAEGFRISIPADMEGTKPVPQVGFRCNLNVPGDFEITVSYEILKADKPTKGYGVGLDIEIVADSPAKDSAVIAHRHHPKKGAIYVMELAYKRADGKAISNLETCPITATCGQLRLTRTGTTLTYSAAADKQDFVQLREADFVDNPLKFVRVRGGVGGSLDALDIRIHTFSIHSTKALGSGGLGSTWSIWLLVIIGFGLLAAVALLAWRYVCKRPVRK